MPTIFANVQLLVAIKAPLVAVLLPHKLSKCAIVRLLHIKYPNLLFRSSLKNKVTKLYNSSGNYFFIWFVSWIKANFHISYLNPAFFSFRASKSNTKTINKKLYLVAVLGVEFNLLTMVYFSPVMLRENVERFELFIFLRSVPAGGLSLYLLLCTKNIHPNIASIILDWRNIQSWLTPNWLPVAVHLSIVG